MANAIKFTDHGEVILSVTLQSSDNRHAVIRFAIQDTGIGIPKDKIGTLFHAFTQVDSSSTKKFGGTGLGLSISKNLVKLMQGEIGAESTHAVGSNFWFSIPLQYSGSLPVAVSIKSEFEKNNKILIIDNNTSNNQILAGRLKEHGYSAFAVMDANHAIDFLDKQGPIRFVLIDNSLEGVSGIELSRKIKMRNLQPKPCLILMTSGGDFPDRQTLEEAGISGSLTKPIQIRHLYKYLENISISDPIGTAFTNSVTANKSLSKIVDPSPLTNIRILLAEDNLINQEVAMTILQKKGMLAQAVMNGREAVTLLATTSFDLVLMDMQMPEMDGLQAARYIRDESSPVINHKVPIIAMTANAMQKDHDACLQAGMDDYISKPFNPDQLIEKIIYWKNSTHSSLVRNDAQAFDVPSSNRDQNPANEAGSAPIEFDALYRRLMDDKELALRLLNKMDARLEENLAEIKLAVESQNTEQVKQLAHKLKGSAGNLSAEPLRRALGSLEKVLMENNWDAIAEEFDEVIARADEFHNAVADLK